jgi:ATP-binding cassette, subfamily F, member 3
MKMSLLTFENIVKEFNNRTLLKGVNLRVEKGEKLALIGPNGAGKTTLLKMAMGMEVCDSGRVIISRGAKVAYLSQDMKEIRNEDKAEEHTALNYEKVAHMEQKLRSLENKLANMSQQCNEDSYRRLLEEYSRLIESYEAMDGYNIENKIKKILMGLGLKQETLTTPLYKLSGGEKMRVMIARILLEEPELMILDEPTNHLDIQATEWLEDFLKKFEGGVIFVSHDRYFLDRTATRIAELEDGTITERSGSYSSFMQQKSILREHLLREQKRLEQKLRRENDIVQELKSMRRISAWKSREHLAKRKKEEQSARWSELREKEHLKKADGPKIAFKKIKHVSNDIAWADNLKKSFQEITLFSGASFHIRGGERVGIIGPNGCGKTTLINMLLGKDKVYEGFIRLGEWVKYSYLGQEILFENEERNMMEELLARKDMKEAEVFKHLARFQFYGDEVYKSIRVLSGGEKMRLYLSCVMLEEPDCLILDEPTNHLDVPARDSIERALKEFSGTIIAISHDRYFLTHCVNRILEISDCRIQCYKGNYEYYRNIKFGLGQEDEKILKSEKKSQAVQPVGKVSGSQAKKQSINPVQVEAEITLLEEKIKSMEEGFNLHTPAKEYSEYDKLVKQVEELYSLWQELSG